MGAVGRYQSSCDCILLSWAALAWDLHLLCLRFARQSQCQASIERRSRPGPLAKAKRRAFARLCFGGEHGIRTPEAVASTGFQLAQCTHTTIHTTNFSSRESKIKEPAPQSLLRLQVLTFWRRTSDLLSVNTFIYRVSCIHIALTPLFTPLSFLHESRNIRACTSVVAQYTRVLNSIYQSSLAEVTGAAVPIFLIFYSVLIAQNAAVFFLQRISTTNS